MLTGVFLCTFALLNVLGLTRIINLSFSLGSLQVPIIIPLGVLPYPITFLCADLITEFYGKKRAQTVIWMGLVVNAWIAFILWVSAFLPPQAPLDAITHLPPTTDPNFAFYQIRQYTIAGIFGSMIAYIVAQILDVHIFQWCKNYTQGRHLWFRSNVSTLLSQLVDTVIVISFSYFFTNAMSHLHGHNNNTFSTLFIIICSGYTYKMIASVLSTIPFYGAVYFLRYYFDTSVTTKESPTQDPVPSTT
ncbi:MAG: queuosine precursor transporter [Proteobacteria bacterium]|nr:queuosine precursor transporter [Pseudomonadota bacterium]